MSLSACGNFEAELAGLAGTMTIDIIDRRHLYTLDYTLAPIA